MSFTTVESAALLLNRDVADLSTFEVDQLDALIKGVDGVISNYCGWNMLATDYEDKRFSGDGTAFMDLKVYPINSVTSVKVRDTTGLFTDITASVEILDGGLLQLLSYQGTGVTTFTAGASNYFITFNAGFTDGNIPSELELAANQLVSINFNKVVDENISADEEVFDNIRFKNSTLELPVVVKRVLDRYRRISVY